MPIYEYLCLDCEDVFERLWQSYRPAQENSLTCVTCGSSSLRKLFPGTGAGQRRASPRPPKPAVPQRKDNPTPVAAASVATMQARETHWQVKEPEDPTDPTQHELGEAHLGAPGWLFVGASLRGRLHAHEGRYREDAFAFACRGGWHIVAVADGAGSASLARVGAREASATCVASLAGKLVKVDGYTLSEQSWERVREFMEQAVLEARTALARQAELRAVPIRELHTTLLVVVHGVMGEQQAAFTVQIGDGSIAGWSASQGVVLLGRPDYGEYANETCFLTQMKTASDIASRFSFISDLPPDLDYLALMTDGVADDFLPAKSQLPKLFEHLPSVLAARISEAPDKLLSLLRYEKKGSFDDRTTAVLGRLRSPAVRHQET